MPKKKKTRAQKILTDQRREVSGTPLYTLPQNMPTSQSKHSTERVVHAATISTSSYKYLGSDLRKTFLVTLFIILAELFIHYFTKAV